MANDSSDSGANKYAFYNGHRFWVQIDNVNVAGFMECSPLVITTEVKEYAEGGLNTYVHKLPGRTRYENITLRHGFDEGQDLFQWYQTILGEPQASGSGGGGGNYRRHISIILYDPLGNQVRRWDLQNAYPVKWTGPSLKADDASPAVETVELAHEGLVPSSTS